MLPIGEDLGPGGFDPQAKKSSLSGKSPQGIDIGAMHDSLFPPAQEKERAVARKTSPRLLYQLNEPQFAEIVAVCDKVWPDKALFQNPANEVLLAIEKALPRLIQVLSPGTATFEVLQSRFCQFIETCITPTNLSPKDVTKVFLAELENKTDRIFAKYQAKQPIWAIHLKQILKGCNACRTVIDSILRVPEVSSTYENIASRIVNTEKINSQLDGWGATLSLLDIEDFYFVFESLLVNGVTNGASFGFFNWLRKESNLIDSMHACLARPRTEIFSPESIMGLEKMLEVPSTVLGAIPPENFHSIWACNAQDIIVSGRFEVLNQAELQCFTPLTTNFIALVNYMTYAQSQLDQLEVVNNIASTFSFNFPLAKLEEVALHEKINEVSKFLALTGAVNVSLERIEAILLWDEEYRKSPVRVYPGASR